MNLVQKQKLDMKQAVNQIQKELPTMTGKEGATSRGQMNNAISEVEDDMEELDENVDYWKDYAESKKQSDELEKQIKKGDGILGKLLGDTKMDKNDNVYTKWFPTRFAIDALGSNAYILLFKEFTQYCKKEFGLNDKADIYKLWLDYTHNVVKMISDQSNNKDKEFEEQTSAGSAGAFSAPMGWDPEDGMSKKLNENEELDEINVGAYSQPAIWAKNKKNWRAVSDPKFPKYGGPGAKYVKIKEKCKHFPYCNQGDINSLEFYEDKKLNEAIQNVSKKTNKSKSYLKNLVLKEMESMFKKDLRKLKNKRMRGELSEEELEEIIRRGFYKSPITSLVGNMKMDTPIGKMYNIKGNKPKYE